MALLDRLVQPFLFRLDPETAHRLAIRGLALGMHPAAPAPDPRLRVAAFGLEFPGPIGLAAGFDKSAEAVDGLLRLGFSAVEIGTVTPRPQGGNPKPRLFRLEADQAIINRFGFNNDGFAAVQRRLAARRDRGGIVGVNIGANKDSADRAADYAAGVAAFADLASYIAINISSPNTPGLRDLQAATALADLLAGVVRARAAAGRQMPLLVKIAPDLDDDGLRDVAAAALDAGIDGIIVANTTLSRDGLLDRSKAAEAGGLSGRPLFRRSTAMLARLRLMVGDRLRLVGVGGVDSGQAAWAKIAAGADFVQVYSGMIFGGTGLPAAINADLALRLDKAGLARIADLVGRDVEKWAAA